MRMYNIYGLNPGVCTGIVQIGFGGDRTVNVRELCYSHGLNHEGVIEQCQSIIDRHSQYLDHILKSLKVGQDQHLSMMHIVPHVIVPRSRPDLIRELNTHFNSHTPHGQFKTIIVDHPHKDEPKSQSIHRIQTLRQLVSPQSLNYINEAAKYKYVSGDTTVGDDYLMDAALNALCYVLDIYEAQPCALSFDATRRQIYEQIKNLPV